MLLFGRLDLISPLRFVRCNLGGYSCRGTDPVASQVDMGFAILICEHQISDIDISNSGDWRTDGAYTPMDHWGDDGSELASKRDD